MWVMVWRAPIVIFKTMIEGKLSTRNNRNKKALNNQGFFDCMAEREGCERSTDPSQSVTGRITNHPALWPFQ
jgi:hypothetical protein